MDRKIFQQKMGELIKEIGILSGPQRKKLEQLIAQTKECHIELEKSDASLQDSLDYLRLNIKYLLFDLEATRQENTYLRKMLEEKGNNNQ